MDNRIGKIVKEILDMNGGMKNVSFEIDKSVATIYNWIYGRTIPSAFDAVSLARISKGRVKHYDLTDEMFNWSRFEPLILKNAEYLKKNI